MIKYTVKKDDNLWKIALAHGFKSEQALLSVKENQDFFKDSERNEYRLFEGDTIFLPEKKVAEHSVKLNGKRVFRTPSKKGFIRLKVHDVEGSPLSDFKYEAELFDQSFSGDQSSHDGDIEIEIPQKKDNNVTLYPTEHPKQEKISKLSDDEKIEKTTALIKLYSDSDQPNVYQEFRVHIQLDPNDKKEGQLQNLSNEGEYDGFIPKMPYEKSLGQVGASCYPDDEWPKHQLSSLKENGSNLLPIPAPINFQPQYYPVVWEMLRYERLYKISRQSLKSLEKSLEELKTDKEPYDTTQTQFLQAEMDTEYYQYCFNYWFSEFSSLWHAHTQKDGAADALMRLRSHVMVDEKLKEVTDKWRAGFESESIKEDILDKPFPEKDIEHIPQLKDVFATYYSTQQAKDKLYTKIVSSPLTSRVRFSYQDDPEQPIANSYVLYWRYDKSDKDKIETGREEFYANARIMMPIGIGKTDKNGYLVQSLPFDDDTHKAHVNTDDGHLTLHAGLDASEGLSHDYLQPFMAKFESSADSQKFMNSIKPLSGEWNDLFNEINKKGALKRYRRAKPHLRREFSLIQASDSYDEQVNRLMDYADDNPYRYKLMRSAVANSHFNYYSSGDSDTWGFMVYPPDAGLVRTADLAAVGNEGKYAYKGVINSPVNQKEFIQLPCTLQEWERRLKLENNKLKAAIESFQVHSSSHQNNIHSLGRMDSLLDLYKKYPYEYEEKDAATSEMREELSLQVNDLSAAIQAVLQEPDKDKDKGLYDALSDMKEAKESITSLLQSEGFSEQFSLYQDAYLNDDDNASPYMELDESWHSVYGSIAEALTYLAMTPDADDVFDTLLKPVLDPLIDSDLVSELIGNGVGVVISNMSDDKGDSIPINRQGDNILETSGQFSNAVEDIYWKLKEKTDEPENSVLNKIFGHPLYQTAQWSKGQLNKWVNDMPGAPSILMVILESYSSFLVREAMANGATKGYHIRLMMVIMHGFGFFSDNGQLEESDILKILRSNQSIRNAAKVNVLEASLKMADKAVEERLKNIKKLEDRVSNASPGARAQLNPVKKRLQAYLNTEENHVFNLQDEIDYKNEKQKALASEEARKVYSNRKANNASNVDDFYDQADGKHARVYKSVLWGITVVGLVEDWSKLLRLNADPSTPSVDMDIVMAHYAKTMTDSAVACSSALLLMNRWVNSENSLFKSGSFLKDNGKFIAKNADRLAVVGSVVALYISSRELYETYNNKTLLEKTDQYLDIAANAVTTLGYVLARGTFNKLLCPLISAYLIPGLGQVLLIAGVLIMLVQIGLGLYVMWQGYRFKRDAAVGYYFWEEFESVRKLGQRYTSDDDNIVGTDKEVNAYGVLIDTYENHESLGKNNTGEGWGHLSWKGAVPLFVSWRQMGMAESQLMNMIDFISKVPDIEFDSKITDSVLTKEISVERLLSPETIVKFYLHLEAVQQSNPNKTILFKQGDTRLSYQAVMNQLEQGTYIPKGETEDVIDHLKGIDDIVSHSSSQFVMNQTRYKNVVWDHEHFKK